MTAHQFIGAALRLIAIWLMLTAARTLAVPLFYDGEWPPGGLGASLAIGLGYAIVAVVLWIFPLLIASAILPRTRQTDTLGLPSAQALAVGSAIIGLASLAFFVMPALSSYLIRAILWIGSGQSLSLMEAERHLGFAESLVQGVIALMLVLKARSIAVRVLGHRPEATAVAVASVSTDTQAGT
jgi:hypothetical protein